MVRTKIIIVRGTISERNGRLMLEADLPSNTVKIAQLAITANGKGSFLLSNRVYFGSAKGSADPVAPTTINEAFVKTLDDDCPKVKSYRFSENAGVGNKIYVAVPSRWGMGIFHVASSIGLQKGGFLTPKSVSITDDETGATEDYLVYESMQNGLNATITLTTQQPVGL